MASTEAVPKALEALTISKTKELKGVRFYDWHSLDTDGHAIRLTT